MSSNQLPTPANGPTLLLRGLRKAFADKFALPSVTKLEDTVRRITLGILDDVLPQGECDFAVDVAGRLPVAVIADMMGVPLGAEFSAVLVCC